MSTVTALMLLKTASTARLCTRTRRSLRLMKLRVAPVAVASWVAASKLGSSWMNGSCVTCLFTTISQKVERASKCSLRCMRTKVRTSLPSSKMRRLRTRRMMLVLTQLPFATRSRPSNDVALSEKINCLTLTLSMQSAQVMIISKKLSENKDHVKQFSNQPG